MWDVIIVYLDYTRERVGTLPYKQAVIEAKRLSSKPALSIRRVIVRSLKGECNV